MNEMNDLTDTPTRDWLTPAEAAMRLKCSAPTVRRLVREGQIPAVRLGPPGSSIRIDRAELEAWLEAPESPVV